MHRQKKEPPGAASERRVDSSPIAELERLRSEVGSLQAELGHAQRLVLLGTLAGMVAHEFNNILTPILAYAQVALSEPDDQALAQRALRQAVAGSERATQIASAILGLVRVEPSGTGEDGSGASVLAAAEGARACLVRDPARDGIQFHMELPPGLAVKAKPVALQQVLLNLFLNARKALGAKGGTITVRARAEAKAPTMPPNAVESIQEHASDNKCQSNSLSPQMVGVCSHSLCSVVVLEIEDSGKGMTESELKRLFEPFVSGGGGTGLGLSVCRRLVGEVGGRLWCQSPGPGLGTTFTVVLPASHGVLAKDR